MRMKPSGSTWSEEAAYEFVGIEDNDPFFDRRLFDLGSTRSLGRFERRGYDH